MNQLVQRLDKINSDSLWNQTFLISWKRAQTTRLRQHLENTSIKKNDYYKINLDLLAQTLLISEWTNCSQRVKHSGSLWLVHRNSNFKMSSAGIFSFFPPPVNLAKSGFETYLVLACLVFSGLILNQMYIFFLSIVVSTELRKLAFNHLQVPGPWRGFSRFLYHVKKTLLKNCIAPLVPLFKPSGVWERSFKIANLASLPQRKCEPSASQSWVSSAQSFALFFKCNLPVQMLSTCVKPGLHALV